MTDIENKISEMLRRYLKAEHDIDASSAWFYGTEADIVQHGSCGTCGWTDAEFSFSICYSVPGDRLDRIIEIDGDPLGFFPTLLKYEE